MTKEEIQSWFLPEPEWVVHRSKKPYDVLIDRSTKWGNPYSHKDGTLAKFKVDTLEEALDKYEKYAILKIQSGEWDIMELENKVLGCWCKPGKCHGDILINLLKHESTKTSKV